MTISLLKLERFRQSPGHCGPASLKIVLKYYGITMSEKMLAKIVKCDPQAGTDTKNIVVAAKKLGFDAYYKDKATLSDIKRLLDKDIPVIVVWFSSDDGHYSVVSGMDEECIYLRDPEVDNIRKIPLDTFVRVWFDFAGDYIKNPQHIVLRRIIAIKKKKNNN